MRCAVLLAPLAWLASACAAGPSPAASDPSLRLCLEAYRAADHEVSKAGVRDAEASQVAGYPHLRANRFLASFAERDLSDRAFDAWIARLAALDREARTIELMNLPAGRRAILDARLRSLQSDWSDTESAIEACAGRLVAATRRLGPEDDAFRRLVNVPDDYSLLARTVGLYPLTAVPVALGYQRWRAVNLPAFEQPVRQTVRGGDALLYRPRPGRSPLDAAEVRELLADRPGRDPLDIPSVSGEGLRALAATFAPALLIEVRSEADRPGWPVWHAGERRVAVDTSRPAAFVRLEHAWFDGRPIVQLVYLFWFDERPRRRAIDLLSGRLDGLIWRVSLGRDGRPVVYDTIHACGCYHLFFPAPGVTLKSLPENRPSDPRDPVLVPGRADVLAPDERAMVRLASGSHYVTGLAALDPQAGHPGDAIGYELVIDQPPDLPLRSMPLPGGGRRSLYRADGIVPGTERGERALLWPMGILEPGAMRQWGRHATAFVGRRHFDDPDLIERGFSR